jgi:hypothetical protein
MSASTTTWKGCERLNPTHQTTPINPRTPPTPFSNHRAKPNGCFSCMCAVMHDEESKNCVWIIDTMWNGHWNVQGRGSFEGHIHPSSSSLVSGDERDHRGPCHPRPNGGCLELPAVIHRMHSRRNEDRPTVSYLSKGTWQTGSRYDSPGTSVRRDQIIMWMAARHKTPRFKDSGIPGRGNQTRFVSMMCSFLPRNLLLASVSIS